MKIDNKMVFGNLIWRFAERIGAKGVSLLVSIVLARILEPEAYGKVALLSVFLTIFSVFVDSGLGNALIQKKNADDDDFTTVFWFNVVWCMILYIFLYYSASFIARFYGDSSLTQLVRVAGITILVSGVKNIQHAYVSKTMQFKKFFWATLGGTVFSGLFGIYLAMSGFGAWALVAQSLSNSIVDTVILWITVEWRPRGKFVFERLKGLFSFGWKLLASSILNTVYNNLRSLIIGKKYTSVDLAYYNKAKGWPDLIVSNINSSINSVLLPTMSAEQDDKTRVKQMTRRAICISTYVMAPMMLGLFCIAPELISLILTDKWLPCVPYMRIFCITQLFYPIHTANLNAIKAMGRSDYFLKLEIIKKIVGMTALLCTMWFGPLVMAYSALLTSFLSQIINAWPNKSLLNYSYIEQMKDIIPNLMIAVIMALCVGGIGVITISPIVKVVVQIIVGALVYISISILTKNINFLYLQEIIKSLVIKRI